MEQVAEEDKYRHECVTGPSPRGENAEQVEIPITNTHMIIDPDQTTETESTVPGILQSRINSTISSVTNELKESSECEFKMTIETSENSDQLESNQHEVIENIDKDNCASANEDAGSELSIRDTSHEVDVKITPVDEKLNKQSQNLLNDVFDKGQEEEYISSKTSVGEHKHSPLASGTLVQDALLTYVDEDDGLLKSLGKFCGINKKKLLDEDSEPYLFGGERRKGSSKGKYEAQSPKIGERYARLENQDTREVQQTSAEKHTAPIQSTPEHVPKNGASDTKTERQPLYVKNKDKEGRTEDHVPSVAAPVVSAPVVRPRTAKSAHDDVYDFTNGKRGYMLLIVNDNFTRQSPRYGAQWDLLKMKEIARKFGFRSLNYNQEKNLTKLETMQLLTRAKNTNHSDCDCFMFMISTHGLEQKNAAKGGQVDHALVCADEQLIFTSTILDMFNDTNCPSLSGKPKLFYIQACRGEKLDHGGELFVSAPISEDKTCSGVIKERRPKRESVDDYDTRPGGDSWTQVPTNYKGTITVPYPQRNDDFRAQDPSNHQRTTTVPYSGPPNYHGTTTVPYPSASLFEGEFRPIHQQTSRPHPPPAFQQHHNATQAPSFYTPRVPNAHQNTPNPTNEYGRHIRSAPVHMVNKIYAPTPYAIVDVPSLKCDNDMLVMFAIPPGMFAWRNTSEGSWMIDYLHQVLMAYDLRKPKSFLSLMTKVTFRMSQRTTNTPSQPSMHYKKAVSVIEHKLTKDILMYQKVPGSEWVRPSNTFVL